MAEPQDIKDNALSQEQLASRNNALGLPSDFDVKNILDSRNLEYNHTPQGKLSVQNNVGNPSTGPKPGFPGRIANDGKRAVLDNSDYILGRSTQFEQSVMAHKNPMKLMQPYSYNGDYDGYNFEKYYKSGKYKDLGFTPYRDNETLYNQNTTFGDEFARASREWGSLVWTGIKSGVQAWTSPSLEPDLKTARAMERSLAVGASSKGGATSFIINNFLNSGHSIGVGLEWLGEELALAYLTAQSAGFAAPETLPAMGLSAAKFGRLLGKGGLSFFQNFKRGRAALNSYKELRTVNEMRNFWNSTQTGKALSAVGRIVNPLGNTIDAMKGIKYADKSYRALGMVNTFGGFAKDMLDIKAAVTEAKLEGGLVTLDAEKKLIDEYRRANNRDPEGEELQKIHELAMSEGYRTAAWNVPVIMLSNKVLHETIFKHFKPSKPKIGDALIDESGAFTVFDKGGFKAFKGTVGERIKLAGKALIKPRTYGKFIKNYTIANFGEAVQENLQETISGAAIDNALRAYNSDDRGAYESFAGDLFSNLGKQFSMQGLETFASGFVMGAISTPAMAALPWASKTIYNNTLNKKDHQAYKEARYKSLEKTAKYLNDMYSSVGKYFAPEMRSAIEQGNIAKDLYSAYDNGDYKGVKDAQNYAKTEAIYTALRTGNYDVMLDKFKEMKNMTPEEIEAGFGLEKGQGNDAIKMMDGFIERAEYMKKQFDTLPDNPYDYSVYKEGSESREAMEYAHQGFEEMRRALIFGYATYDNNIRRLKSMSNTVASIAKPFEKLDATHITNIMSPADAQREINLLKSEIATMEKASDTLTDESKKELEYKKKYLEHLTKLEDSLGQAEFAYDTEMYNAYKEDLKQQGVDLDKTAPKRDESGNWEKGTLVHDSRKNLGEENSVAKVVESDSTGYLLDNGEFVERDEVEPITAQYLQELMQVDASDASRKAYRDFLTFVANENNDLVFNDKMEESFQMLLDFRAKNKENINLVRYINYMNDPRTMLETAARVTKAMSKAHKERLKSIISRISNSVKKYELNRGIQELYKDGWYAQETDFENLYKAVKLGLKDIPVPDAFIQVSTGETFKKGTPEYDKALDVWNKHLPAIMESFKEQYDAQQKKSAEEQAIATNLEPDEQEALEYFNNQLKERVDALVKNGMPPSEAETQAYNELFMSPDGSGKFGRTKDGEYYEQLKQKAQQKPEEVVEEEVEEEFKSEVVTPDMKYDDYPQALKDLLEPAYQKYLADNNITPEEETSEMKDLWLSSVSASRIISKWNNDTKKREAESQLLGKRRKAAEPPSLKTVPLVKGKTLNDFTIPELQKMLTDLRASQKTQPSTDKEDDIKALDEYIKYRKGIAVKTPGTEAQKKAVDNLKSLKDEIINKSTEDKSYLIQNVAYERATTVVRQMMEVLYNYKRDPFASRAEANIVTSLAKEIIARNGTPAEFIAELRKSAVNDVVLGRYNKRKLDKIQEYLEANGLTEENVLNIFDKFQNEHTTIRGNNVDKHIRQFFETGELGTRPSYFSEEAWVNLDKALNALRDKMVAAGLVVVANDVTTFDNDALVAGTLDLLVIDKNGKYQIYDIKTGSKRKWNKYEKPEAGMPHSADMMENILQLSIYKRLLENQTGIDVTTLGIVAIEVEEDLDGNILALSSPRDSAIRLEYDDSVELKIPKRSAPEPVKETTPAGEVEQDVTTTSQGMITYFKGQLDAILKIQGRIANRIDEVQKDLDKEAGELEIARKELLDLQTFLDKASPKELKGKKRKIKAEIKRLEERTKQLEANHALLMDQQTKLSNTRKRLNILQDVVLDAIDELPKKEINKIKIQQQTLREYLTSSISKINNVLAERSAAIAKQIDTIEDRILDISVALEKLGMTDALIDLYLQNQFSPEYLRGKLAEGTLSERDTKIYSNLLNLLTTKEGADFRTTFKKLTRELSKNYIERAKLQAQYQELYEMGQTITPLEEISTRRDYLIEALAGLNEAVEFSKTLKPEPEPTKPMVQKTKLPPTQKKEAAKTEETKPAKDLSGYVGKRYQAAKFPELNYIVIGISKDGKIIAQRSDNQMRYWAPEWIESQKTADSPDLYEIIDEEEDTTTPPPAASTTDTKAALEGTVSDKKADIERRRQEELISAVTTPISYEDFVKTKPKEIIVNNYNVYKYDNSLKKYVLVGAASSTDTSLESIAAREEGAKDVEFFKDKSLKLDTVNFFWSERITGRSPITKLLEYKKRTKQGRIDERVGQALVDINAKYDAELAALEGGKEAIPTAEPITTKVPSVKPEDLKVNVSGTTYQGFEDLYNQDESIPYIDEGTFVAITGTRDPDVKLNGFAIRNGVLRVRVGGLDQVRNREGAGTQVSVKVPEGFDSKVFEEKLSKITHDEKSKKGGVTTDAATAKVVEDIRKAISESSLVEGKPTEEEGVLTFTDNNPELIINGNKKLTNRKTPIKDGVYTIQRKDGNKYTPTNIQVKITKLGEAKVNTEGVVPEVSIDGNHVDSLKAMGIPSVYVPSTNSTVIDADTYAKSEGFKDWKDFEANNKDSSNFIKGTQPRVIYSVEPVKKPKPTTTKVQPTKRSDADIRQLKSIGLSEAIINKLTDAEFEQALTFDTPEDAIELIEKYHVPIPKEVITLEQAKSMIDGATGYRALLNVYEKILRAASFNKLENPIEVQTYYQQKLNEKMTAPFIEDLEPGTLVEIGDEVYKVTKVGKTVSVKQLGGNNTMNIPAAETSITINRIIDPKSMEEEPTPEVNKDEVQPIKTTLETSSESTPEQNLENLKRGEEYKNGDAFASYKKKPCNS